MVKKIRLGVFGLGVVGSGLLQLIERRRAHLAAHAGVSLEVVAAVVRDPNKTRSVATTGLRVATDPNVILEDPSIDVVVELMGGVEAAGNAVSRALSGGKAVVTANKALVASRGKQLLQLAHSQGVPLYAEASVGGGVPILKTLRESLVANDITRLTAIINGTTNFVLSKMAEGDKSYDEALRMAQEAGFAEADPTMDVDGTDARQKLQILAAHMCGGVFPEGEILCEGITTLAPSDFAYAQRRNLSIKLLAMARKITPSRIELRVHPTLIPKPHPLAAVHDEFNAIHLHGDAVGEIMLEGRGAGSLPTASAVYADIVDICMRPSNATPALDPDDAPRTVPMTSLESEFFLRFCIDDKPGVLGAITTVLGHHGISLRGAAAELVPNRQGVGEVHITAHRSTEAQVHAAMTDINGLAPVREPGHVLRIARDI